MMADSLTEVEKYAQNESGTQKQVHPDDEEEEVDTVFRKNMATTLIHQGCDCGLE